jgi:tetraspanin-18
VSQEEWESQQSSERRSSRMVADCGANCARWLLCLSNFVFISVSTGVLLVGSWLAADKASFISLTLNITAHAGSAIDEDAKEILKDFVEPTVIEQAAYMLIALGALVLIISILGYCGALKESRVLLTAYGIFLVIIFLLMIALILLCTLYKPQADHHTKGFLKDTLEKYYTTENKRNAVTLSWDHVMAQMSCCGVDGYKDFEKARPFTFEVLQEGTGAVVPAACCMLQGDRNPLLITPMEPNCIRNPTESNSFLNMGCYGKLNSHITDNLDLVIGAIVGVAAAQLLAIVFAFCLCRAVGHERDYHYKY